MTEDRSVQVLLTPTEAWKVYDLLAAKTAHMETAEEAIQSGIGSDGYRAIRDRFRAELGERLSR